MSIIFENIITKPLLNDLYPVKFFLVNAKSFCITTPELKPLKSIFEYMNIKVNNKIIYTLESLKDSFDNICLGNLLFNISNYIEGYNKNTCYTYEFDYKYKDDYINSKCNIIFVYNSQIEIAQ
jgi:hypothetical protein